MTDLCHCNPLFYDASPLRRRGGGRQRAGSATKVVRLAEQGHDDMVGDGVELRDGGSDGGRHVFLLVPLGPHTAQTLVGHHSDKQSLECKQSQIVSV